MQQTTSTKTIAAMPAHNEAQYIGSLVLLVRRYADEVIVVDDGSTDQTAGVARLAGATIIRHERKKGKGAAVQQILAAAAERNADALVLLDADFQHDPEEIPSLLKALAEGNDLVIGRRTIARNRIPLYRFIGQRFLSYLTRVLAGQKVSDTESGFRALSRKAISEIHIKESGFAVEAEMISEAFRKGLKVAEVPVSIIYSRDGSTMNPIRHGVGNFNRILAMISERRPLLFFGLAGGALIVLGIVAGVSVVMTYSVSNVLATGTALISMLLTTIGVLCVFSGIILNVLSRRIGILSARLEKDSQRSE